jgi:hypothetical protein
MRVLFGRRRPSAAWNEPDCLEELKQVGAVEPATSGEFNPVEAPLAGFALRDERGVGVEAIGDLLLGQASLLSHGS